jgi:hypothetical protein
MFPSEQMPWIMKMKSQKKSTMRQHFIPSAVPVFLSGVTNLSVSWRQLCARGHINYLYRQPLAVGAFSRVFDELIVIYLLVTNLSG